MNLDDFILPTSIASPTDNSPSPTTDSAMTSSNAVASAIPIKAKKETQDLNQFPPSAPPQDRIARNREFDYVQRRLRKTSIDETRVGGLVNNLFRIEPMLMLGATVTQTASRVFSPGQTVQQHHDTHRSRWRR